MQQDGHRFQAYTIKRDRRQTSTQIFEGIAIPTSCHTNVSLGTNVSLSSRQPSSDHHGLQSLPMETRRIPKFLEASHGHHYFQSRRCFFPFLLLKRGLKSGSLKMRQNHCRMKGAFTVSRSWANIYLLHSRRPKKSFCRFVHSFNHKGASVSCLSVLSIDIVYLLTMHAAGYMHSFLFNAVLFVSSLGMKLVWLTLVQALGRLNPSPLWAQRRGASASLGVLLQPGAETCLL